MTNSQNGQEANDDGTPDQFVRNRFFNGKLMTARDMAAEQEYHAGRLESLTRNVTGWGIVCGLEARIEPGDGPENPPRAIVEPGVAIDGTGRLIVVSEKDSKPLAEGTPSSGDIVSVYVQYTTCLTESVPAHGSEDACKEECDYNRVRETYTIETDAGTPGNQKAIPIERVRLPTAESFLDEDGEVSEPDPDHPALHEPAASYHEPDNLEEDNRVRSCRQPEPDKVYLGSFRRGDEEWSFLSPTDDSVPRPYVYNNDMLYAGLLDHVTNFENPHEVSVSIVEEGEDPSIGIDQPDVQIRGSDGIEVEGDGSTIYLSGGDGGMDILKPLARYLEEDHLRRDALRQIACTFEELRDQFEYVEGAIQEATPTAVADGIVSDARDALAGRRFEEAYEHPGEFIKFVDDHLQSPFATFEQTLPGFVGNTGEFEDARNHLDAVIEDVEGEDGDNEANRLALALLRFCKAASCLSGRCIRFDQFADRTPITSPLTMKDTVVTSRPNRRESQQGFYELPAAWGFVPRIVSFDEGDRKALEFLQPGLRIEVPPTEEVEVVGRNGELDVDAYDTDGTTVDSDGPGETLSVSRDTDDDPITYLDIGIDAGTPATTPLERTLEEIPQERLEEFQEDKPETGQLVSICVQ